MKLNFKNFRIPVGIAKKNYNEVDVREQIADLLYTHANGVRAHSLAFKILDSNGDEDYTMDEAAMVRQVVEHFCVPCVIDAFDELIESQTKGEGGE